MHERGMLHDVDHPVMGKIVLPSSPMRFGGSEPPALRLEPEIGEHTDAILSEWLDMDAKSASRLRDEDVLI
jgi:crotonobetainyl-CoA:carnitine CoA-transferase CaiB-like acyl-CoA transferase